MNSSSTCYFCSFPGILRLEDRGVRTFICNGCWALLKKKETALPLIRGNLTLRLRGKIPPNKLEEILNNYMGEISKWEIRQ